MNNKFLTVENLAVEYTQEDSVIHAVNGVSFEIEKGKTFGLVGETGAGKTSIAKSILRILPDIGARVTSGSISLGGTNLMELSEKEMQKIRGHKISMIFQDPMTALNPVQRVGDQIAESIILHNSVSKEEAARRAAEMLETVGIPAERYIEYPHQFSGGMKQRVVIAMALACSPELLLADEPTTALDVTIQAQVLEMINDLKKKFETSMLLITHDLGVVAEVCDDVAVIYAGKIVEYGSLSDVFEHTAHPYTEGLFGALPELDDEVERLVPIPGLPADPTNLPEGCAFAPRCKYATSECTKGEIPVQTIKGKHICRCCHALRREG